MNKKLIYMLMASFMYAPLYAHTIVEQKLKDHEDKLTAFSQYYLGKQKGFKLFGKKNDGKLYEIYQVNGQGIVAAEDSKSDKAPYNKNDHGRLVWQDRNGDAIIELTTQDLDRVYPFQIKGYVIPRVAALFGGALVAVIALENIIRWGRAEKEQNHNDHNKKKSRSKPHAAE